MKLEHESKLALVTNIIIDIYGGKGENAHAAALTILLALQEINKPKG